MNWINRVVVIRDRVIENPLFMTWSILMILAALLLILMSDMSKDVQFSLSVFLLLSGFLLWLKKDVEKIRVSLMVLSMVASFRYIWWRGFHTLNLDNPIEALLSISLFAAEIYVVIILFLIYFQILSLDRSYDNELPDINYMPSVDIFIPTYNESADILRRTISGAQGINYLKRTVYVLDDGNRNEIKQLATELGCNYITRPDNKHAKAGNINHALQKTTGDLIAIFDADFIPSGDFLLRTVHFFKDSKVALVQTPHRFMNPGPVERNLYLEGQLPQEGELFYQLNQVGNNRWNAAMFCGSAAVLRRSVLNEIGGIATETVTEDCHTSLKMHALGYKSIYISIPLAVGLSPESFEAHIIQRSRWARGMIQIMRSDCPLFKKGLSWPQRICYFASMSHFLFGLPRLLFILAPLAFLVFNLHLYRAGTMDILTMFLPHITLASLAANYQYHNFRHSYWSEVYETILAPYYAYVTTLALINPAAGKFNVTPKGDLSGKPEFKYLAAWPLIVCFLLCLIGLISCPARILCSNDILEKQALLLNAFWAICALILVSVALLVALERPYGSRAHRVRKKLPVKISLGQRKETIEGNTLDINEYGALVEIRVPLKTGKLKAGDKVVFVFARPLSSAVELRINAIVKNLRTNFKEEQQLSLEFSNLSAAQSTSLAQLIYSDNQTWGIYHEPKDRIWQSYWTIITTPWRVAWQTLHSYRAK